MEKITYVGLERCDFVYHLANILSLQGSVLVIDNSYNLDLIDAISTTGEREIREWRNIVYVNDVDLMLTDVSDYDYVLVYAGMAFEPSDFEDNIATLIMPDYTKTSIMALSAKMPKEISNPIYIMRDNCTKKFSIKSISQLLNMSPKEITGWINLDANDMGAYVSLTHNHYSNIKAVSSDMNEALRFVAARILDIEGDNKKIERVMKAATKIK